MTKNIAVAPPTAAWHQVPAWTAPRSKRTARFWLAWVVAVIAAVALVLTFVLWPKPVPSTERLILAVSLSQQEAFPNTLPEALGSRAQALAKTGGGEVVGVVAAGSAGEQVSDPVSLRIANDGELENDDQTRQDAVTRRLAGLLAQLKLSSPVDPGRSLTGLIDGVSSVLGSGENEVWLETFGLPTTPGEDTRLLTAADPGAAAAAVPSSAISPLKNVKVHLVLLPPTGNQPSLNATTDRWRRAFVTDVVRRSGASVTDVTEDTVPSAPVAGAPVAPPVPNIVVTTKVPKVHPVTPTQPLSIHLDTSTTFSPDTANWVSGPGRVEDDLKPVVKAWLESHGQLVVSVTGYCARFGPAGGAKVLSQERADKVAGLLRADGVTVIEKDVVGKGFADPLPDPDPQSPNNRTVIVTARSK